MAERFFCVEPLSPGPFVLSGPEAHHLAVVRRFRKGDFVRLFSGDGGEHSAQIDAVDKRSVHLTLGPRETPERESPVRVEVAAPLPKGDRAAFLIEKLTELGVARFTPLECDRAVVHPKEGKLEKLTRYVIEASKQCGRNCLMEIAPPTAWSAYAIERVGELRILGSAGASGDLPASAGPIRIVVGPEGGFTANELELAAVHAWRPLGLGSRTLRTETAALALAAQFTR